MWPRVLTMLILALTATCRGQEPPCCAADNVFDVTVNRCRGVPGDNNGLLLDCSHRGVFLLDPLSMPDDAFNLTDEGHIVNTEMDYITYRGSFCLARLLRGDGNVSAETAALVCFPEQPTSGVHYFTYAVCLCVSVVFLLATLLVYWALPRLRDLQGKTLMCAVASLCMGEVFIAVGQLHKNGIAHPTTCVVIAFLMYFWMMSAFFWMNVVSFNLWHSVIFRDHHTDKNRLFTYYCLYGWGAPMVFLMAGLITEHVPGEHIKPNFGNNRSCWFQEPLETWSYFYGPMAVLMTCNAIFFVWTLWRLWKDCRNTSMPKLRMMRFKCLLYLKLFVIMGISWIFELLSFMFDGNSGFWIVMDIINSLHGIFIFVVVVMRKRVLQALVQTRPCGLPYPKSWAAGVDEESETMLAEEAQLSSTNANN